MNFSLLIFPSIREDALQIVYRLFFLVKWQYETESLVPDTGFVADFGIIFFAGAASAELFN